MSKPIELNWKFFVFIALIATALFLARGVFQVITPSQKSFISVYNGIPRGSDSGQYQWWIDRRMEESGSSINILGYTFVSTKYNQYASEYCTSIPKYTNSNTETCRYCNIGGGYYSNWGTVYNGLTCNMFNDGAKRQYSCIILNTTTDAHNCTVQKRSCTGWAGTTYCGCSNAGCNTCDCSSPYKDVISYVGNYTISTTGQSGYVNWGCSEQVKVYKNGVLIDTVGELSSNNAGSTLRPNAGMIKQYGDVQVTYMQDYSVSSSDTTCYSVMNLFVIKPSQNISFNTYYDDYTIDNAGKYNYESDEPLVVKVNITNPLSYSLFGILKSNVCAETAIGKMCKEYTSNYTLNPGFNHFEFTTGSSRKSKIYITNKLEVYVTYSTLGLTSGNNECAPDGQNYGLAYCKSLGYDKISLGEGYDLESTIIYTPKPIYIIQDCAVESCLSDYTCSSDSSLCIRSDVLALKLDCQKLGCPSDSAHQYQCMSDGACAQVITQQCAIDSDCPEIACYGASYKCTNNVCMLQGKCINQPKELTFWNKLSQVWSGMIQWVSGIFKW